MKEIVLVPGDGIGKEIANSVIEISKVLTPDIEFIKHEAGSEYYQEHNELFDNSLFTDINKYKLCIKGPTATPIGSGFRSINVLLRQEFNCIFRMNKAGMKLASVPAILFNDTTSTVFSTTSIS